MELRDHHTALIAARAALAAGRHDDAVLLAGPCLEGVLRSLAQSCVSVLPPEAQSKVYELLKPTGSSPPPTMKSWAELFGDPRVFLTLQETTGRSTRVLSRLDLDFCRTTRNEVAHQRKNADPSAARYLVDTTAQFLAFLGIDVDNLSPEDCPLQFDSAAGCSDALGWRLWDYPLAGGVQASWAVKESEVLKGNLEKARDQPGLGIALFTTELALEIHGTNAVQRIQGAVNWGVNKTDTSPPYLIRVEQTNKVTGDTTWIHDLRHTLALAILMGRAMTHGDHQRHYRSLLLQSVLPDGGWPAILGQLDSEIASTVYALVFLSEDCAENGDTDGAMGAILRGQEWVRAISVPGGGWTSPTFRAEPWERLWTTSYLLQLLLSAPLPSGTVWKEAMERATASVLSDVCSVLRGKDELLTLRLEARAAAAISHSLRYGMASSLVKERAESWLDEWEARFLRTASHIPRRLLDLATTTFALRALRRRTGGASVLEAGIG